MGAKAIPIVFRRESWCREGELNPQGTKYRRILSPLRLPVPPSRLAGKSSLVDDLWVCNFSRGPGLKPLSFAILVLILVFSHLAFADAGRWSEEKANRWYQQQPWLVGSNFIPADAINELEMWQAATFDPQEIDKELGWAQGLGMNTMRVFLHDLLWQQDAAGFRQRIDAFLTIAAKHKIRPVFVLFDSCWDPFPKLGPQHPPIPGVHNSGWVQSPGADALRDVDAISASQGVRAGRGGCVRQRSSRTGLGRVE